MCDNLTLFRVLARVTVVVPCTSTRGQLRKDNFKLWKELFLVALAVVKTHRPGTLG